MDALITSIVMAVISSLAFVAYKHPKGYARMFVPLMVITCALWFLWFAVSLSYDVGFSRGLVAIMQLNHKALDLPEQPHSPTWFFILPGAFTIYLQILKFLPTILDLPTDGDKYKPKDKVSEKGSDNDA